jgi:hypothetical protein
MSGTDVYERSTKPYKIGVVRTPAEVREAREEERRVHAMVMAETAKIMREVEAKFPAEVQARREAERARLEQVKKEEAVKKPSEPDWVDDWPRKSQELAKKAPSVRGVRRPHDGPDDYYGTRAEGARFHTHFSPIYPLGTPRHIILRDYVLDCPSASRAVYINACLKYCVDPKTNPRQYDAMLFELAHGLSETFVENNPEQRSMFWDGDKGLDARINLLITSPLAHETVRQELLDIYPELVKCVPESEHEPEERKKYYAIMVDSMMEYFHKDKKGKAEEEEAW